MAKKAAPPMPVAVAVALVALGLALVVLGLAFDRPVRSAMQGGGLGLAVVTVMFAVAGRRG